MKRASLRLLALVTAVTCLSGCAQPDASYHLRFWEWYNLQAERSLAEPEAAERFAAQALQEARNFQPSDVHLLVSLNRLADIYKSSKRYAEAGRLYQEALHGWNLKRPTQDALSNHEGYRSLLGLAELSAQQGRDSDAQSFYEQAVQTERQLHESQSHDVQVGQDMARTLFGLAAIYQQQGNNVKAQACLLEALTLADSCAASPDLMHNIASEFEACTTGSAGSKDSGLVFANFPQLLASAADAQGSSSPWLNNYRKGWADMAQDKYQRAAANFKNALSDLKGVDAADPRVPMTLDGLATACLNEEDTERAKAILLKALSIMQSNPGASNVFLAITLQNLGDIAYSQGKWSEAKQLYAQEYSLLPNFMHDSTEVVLTKPATRLATIYCQFSESATDIERGEALCQKQIEVLRDQFGEHCMRLTEPYRLLAFSYAHAKRWNLSESAWDRVVNICESNAKIHTFSFADALDQNSHVCRNQSKSAKAASLLKRAIGVWEEVNGPNCLNSEIDRLALADIYMQDGDAAKATETAAGVIPQVQRLSEDQRKELRKQVVELTERWLQGARWQQSAALYEATLPDLRHYDDEFKEVLIGHYVALLGAYKKEPPSEQSRALLQRFLGKLEAQLPSVLAGLDVEIPRQRQIAIYSVWLGDETTKLGQWSDAAALYMMTLPLLERFEGVSSDVVSRYETVIDDYVRLRDFDRAQLLLKELLRKVKQQHPLPMDFYTKLIAKSNEIQQQQKAK